MTLICFILFSQYQVLSKCCQALTTNSENGLTKPFSGCVELFPLDLVEVNQGVFS